MSNSAFTPTFAQNLQDASATQSGLVNTSSQTFAGKKTLDGGALIKGDTTGSAIAAGYVGEKITWASAPATQSTTTSIADWTNASITLTAGVWLIQANICCVYITGLIAGDSGATLIRITDASNNIVENMDKQNAVRTAAASNTYCILSIPFSFVKSVNTSTTYKIRISHANSAGTGGGIVYNESNNKSEFFAIRIA